MTTLFEAIELTEGRIISDCMLRHRHQEWIKFLKKIGAETSPELDLQLMAECHRTLVQESGAEPYSKQRVEERHSVGRDNPSLRRPPQCKLNILRVAEESRRRP